MMKALSFKITSNHMLLLVFLCLLWDVTESNTTLGPHEVATATTPEAKTAITDTTTAMTTPLTTKPPPNDVDSVTVVERNENNITLQWKKVDNIVNYFLTYRKDGDIKNKSINASTEGESITHVVTDLTARTIYNFTLFTISDGKKSPGYKFTSFTSPPPVQHLGSVAQNETSITLQWKDVDEIFEYTVSYNEVNVTFSASPGTISGLESANIYDFSVFAVFQNIRSIGTTISAPTAPSNAEDITSAGQTENSITLEWTKVDKSELMYKLVVNGTEEIITASEGQRKVNGTISGLTSGTRYVINVFTLFENITSSGANFSAPTAPRNTQEMKLVGRNETSMTFEWTKVDGIFMYVLVANETKEEVTAPEEQKQVTGIIPNLKSGTQYNISLFAVFENVTSSGFNITAFTAPRNTEKIEAVGQNETSITLQWEKVDDILEYKLVANEGEEIVNASKKPGPVQHTISRLTSGTKYNISVFVLLSEDNPSSGKNITAATAPSQVTSVRQSERSVTKITLEWEDVGRGWSYIVQMNQETKTVQLQPKKSTNLVSCSFDRLTPGTVYQFNMTSEFFGLKSKASEDFTATVIDCGVVPWHVTSSSIQGVVEGMFTNATATNGSQTHVSLGGSNVSFTGLYPGATYDVSLVYERNNRPIPMCKNKLPIPPSDVKARCKNWAGGYSVNVDWDEPVGLWTAVEVNVTGKNHIVSNNGEGHVIIPGFQPAQTYEVSIALLSGNVRSQQPYVFSCFTDARGVIAGSFFAVLLFAILVCVAVFIWFKRPDIIRRNKPFIGGSKLSEKKCKAISVEKFPDHFNKLSMDENRGFSEEYECVLTVGKEQTQKEATLSTNMARNRYNNVLPYDWCRVKLNTSNPGETSDYINASYMPGYSRSREYIATQGPLPATVKDFWRMVWEQRVQGIVMVTNCTENGRVKCEQYWPADSQPCSSGELEVTVTSVEEEPNWTLRDFRIKHESTLEERTVKHFHFTAWPDHGVPQGTEVLIQFRGLVRQHIERDGAGAPTVVHCSAGVGRTGTIVALDVLLQQIQKEGAVGINAFVRKMRLSRPHMVQTESQYVFLHQCILDYLKPKEKNEENIYENADMIYANATALREFNSNV